MNSDSNIKKTVIHLDTANPSVQTKYTHPFSSEGPKSYSDNDKGPFIVHMSWEISDPASGTTIRSIKFGQFLHTHKVSVIINDGLKNVGHNKISVVFSTSNTANLFLVYPIIEMCKYKATVPTFNVTRMGLIKDVPVDRIMEELATSLDLPTGCGEVLKVRHLNRKTYTDGVPTWVPTQSVVITFRGQMLPKKVYSYHTSLPIETYKLPTIQCLNCCHYGHIKTQFRSQPRCFKCSKSHTVESCNVSKDNATCLHCSGNHCTTDKDCPEFSGQQSIKIVMSQDNISYIEASSRSLLNVDPMQRLQKRCLPLPHIIQLSLVNLFLQLTIPI
nr:uncharacterized protein LOC113403767 [Vanessa tameamea]